MHRPHLAPLALLLLGSACTVSSTPEQQGKALPESEGTVNVESSELHLPSTFTSWQARVEARHDLSAATEGREEVVYQMSAGAQAPSESVVGLGFHLYGAGGSGFGSGNVHELADAEASGVKNQISVETGTESWVSDGGSVSITSFEAGLVSGSFRTSLVRLGFSDAPVDLTGTFQGVISASCYLYDFPENGSEGTWDTVGVEDRRCAALFD